MTRIVRSLAEISDAYDAVFCDLWGCLHDGLAALPEAVAALRAFKARGGSVVLLTNAPRPRASVADQIARLGVPDDCWDTIATSGDSARVAMFGGAVGRKVWFIGQPRDEIFFEPLNIVQTPTPIVRVPLQEAEGIVCCGPFDPLADPEIMRPQFLYAREKGLVMLSANPDIQVDRGESREWCGGALARLYERMGGTALSFGKPHPPVYDLARRRLHELGEEIPDDRILAIGDGIATDIQGAIGEGLDALFVTGGLAGVETGTHPSPDQQPDPALLDRYLSNMSLDPLYSIGKLR